MTSKTKQPRRNQSTTTAQPGSNFLSDTCHYCGRVRWGDWQYLLGGEWRHEECYPGSQPWREYYERLPDEERTDAMRFIYNSMK